MLQASGITGFTIYSVDVPETPSAVLLQEPPEIENTIEIMPEPHFEPAEFAAASGYSAEHLHDLDDVRPNLLAYISGEYFGHAIAYGDINNDGIGDMIVGAHRADTNGADSGTTYVIFGSSDYKVDTINLATTQANLTIYGRNGSDWSGFAVASGDINNDNIDDVIISGYLADPNGDQSGEAYVVFGSSSYSNNVINLTATPANITIYGASSGDRLGSAVASGDINNDNIDDLIVGAHYEGTNGGNSGTTYVIFGSSVYTQNVFNLSAVQANLTIYGNGSSNYLGSAVASGDINNDGIGDVITGAYGADPHGDDEGRTYVIFGSSVYTQNVINLSAVQANLTVEGDDTDEFSGFAVSSGNINGDVFDDVIIGAYGAQRGVIPFVGRTYVIFGSSVYSNNVIDLRVESANLTIQGDDQDDQSGRDVSFGDINGDGIDDVIIAARQADPNGLQSGEVYVIFGSSAYSNSFIDLDTTPANITIYGDDTNDYFGQSVSSGDLNGDGINDIFVGSESAGETYAFFGTVCPCHNCSDCEAKLNDSYCNIGMLTQNITATDTCINFPASSKEFDCLGNTILGNGSGYGINMTGRSNVKIQNCVISNFSRGLSLQYSSNNNLTNIQVSDTSSYGVYLFYSNSNNLSNVNTRDGYYGYLLSGSHNNILDDITVESHFNSNYGGIFSSVSENNSYNNLNLYNNSPYGIYLYESQNNNITNSKFDNNSQYGILLSGDYCRNIRIINVNASRNNIAGIRMYQANNNTLANLNFSGNYNDGISTNNAGDNNFTNFTANYNTDDGIYMDFNSSYNIFINGDVIGNGDTGVYMGHSSNDNTFTNITVHSNNNGITLSSCSNNEFINITDYNHTTGLSLSSSNNNLIKDSAVRNCSTGISLSSSNYNIINNTNVSRNPIGMKLSSSSHNNITYNRFFDNRGSGDALHIIVPVGGFFPFSNNYIAHNLFWNNTKGLNLDNEENNAIENNTFWDNDYAIYINRSTQNNFTNNRINISNIFDLFLHNSSDNPFKNLTIGTNYTTSISFIYASDYDIMLKSVEIAPAKKYNISKYVNITVSNGLPSLFFLNISYSDSDVPVSFSETSLKIWKYTGVVNGGPWYEEGWNGTRVLDTSNNIVGVNITNFASIYAPFVSDITPPSNATVVLNATSVNNYTTDNLTCYANATDERNTTIIAYFRWYNNSNEITSLAGSSVIPNATVSSVSNVSSTYTTKNDNWICSVLTSDGRNNASWRNSSILTIENTAPQVQNVVFNSTDDLNRTTGTLQGFWTFYDIDVIDSQQDYETRWYNSSSEVAVLANLTTVAPGNTTKGENWSFGVRVYDGNDWSSWVNSTNLTIQNSAPTHSQPVLNSTYGTNYPHENLTCYNQSLDDADSDPISTRIQWFVNDAENITFENQTSILSDNTSVGQQWICSVTPGDGIEYGTALNSSALTIVAVPTAAPSVGGGGAAVRPGVCIPFWECGSWSDCVNGIQKRTCIDKRDCIESYEETRECVPSSCTDGIRNRGELKVNQVMSIDLSDISDCGGLYCPPCPTCDDSIQNQKETGVDCGGPCAPCASCFDDTLNQGETGVDCGGPCAPCIEMPVGVKEINLFWLLLILLIALVVADGYCIYQHYHKKDKSARKTYEILTILLLVGVVSLSAYLAYTSTVYVLVIPISLIIFIIIVTWHFSMPELIARFEARRKKRFAEKKKMASRLEKEKKLEKIRIRKEEIEREKAKPEAVIAGVRKEKELEAERRKREAIARERAQLREERARLLEEQKLKRQEEFERERIAKAKIRERRKIEKQKEKEKKRIEKVKQLTIARINKEKELEAKRRKREARRRRKERERLEKEELKRKRYLKQKAEKERLAGVLKEKKLARKRERKEKWIEELGEKEELAGVLKERRLEKKEERKEKWIEELGEKEELAGVLKEKGLEKKEERKEKWIEELGEKERIGKAKKEYAEDLNEFINNAIKTGYTKEQIKKALVRQGWPKRFVNNYCNKFFEVYGKKEISRIKETTAIEKALEVEREGALASLNKFINNALGKGKSKNAIKRELTKAGWPSRFIKEYMERFFGR